MNYLLICILGCNLCLLVIQLAIKAIISSTVGFTPSDIGITLLDLPVTNRHRLNKWQALPLSSWLCFRHALKNSQMKIRHHFLHSILLSIQIFKFIDEVISHSWYRVVQFSQDERWLQRFFHYIWGIIWGGCYQSVFFRIWPLKLLLRMINFKN